MKTTQCNRPTNRPASALVAAFAVFSIAPSSAQIDLINLGVESQTRHFHAFQTDGSLVAFADFQSGEQSWQYGPGNLYLHDAESEVTDIIGTIDHGMYWSSVENDWYDPFLLANGRVVFRDPEGRVRIHDHRSGQSWDTGLDTQFHRHMAVSGDLVFLRDAAAPYQIHVLDASSGASTPLGITHDHQRYWDFAPWVLFDGPYAIIRGLSPTPPPTAWSKLSALYLYDTRDPSGGVVQIAEPGTFSHAVDNGLLAFSKDEGVHDMDLNGDGDTYDDVLHVYDYRNGLPGELVNLGVTTNDWSSDHHHLVKDGLVVYQRWTNGPTEPTQYLFDFKTDPEAIIDLGGVVDSIVRDVVIDGGRAVYRWDPDPGTAFDEELRVYDRTTGTISTLDQRATPISLQGNWLVYEKPGLASEWRLCFHNFATGTTVEVPFYYRNWVNGGLAPVAQPSVRQSGNLVVFEIEETDTDLNGDGDLNDTAVHAFDFETGVIRNLGISSETLHVSTFVGTTLAFSVQEDGQDLNGDGDTWDDIAHLVRIFSVQPTVEEVIAALTEIVEEFNLSQGLVNSLNAQLDGVLDALDPDNPAQGETTYERLEAFISAVEAQRGKKLTDEQADALIESAHTAQLAAQ